METRNNGSKSFRFWRSNAKKNISSLNPKRQSGIDFSSVKPTTAQTISTFIHLINSFAELEITVSDDKESSEILKQNLLMNNLMHEQAVPYLRQISYKSYQESMKKYLSANSEYLIAAKELKDAEKEMDVVGEKAIDGLKSDLKDLSKIRAGIILDIGNDLTIQMYAIILDILSAHDDASFERNFNRWNGLLHLCLADKNYQFSNIILLALEFSEIKKIRNALLSKNNITTFIFFNEEVSKVKRQIWDESNKMLKKVKQDGDDCEEGDKANEMTDKANEMTDKANEMAIPNFLDIKNKLTSNNFKINYSFDDEISYLSTLQFLQLLENMIGIHVDLGQEELPTLSLTKEGGAESNFKIILDKIIKAKAEYLAFPEKFENEGYQLVIEKLMIELHEEIYPEKNSAHSIKGTM